MAFLMGMEVSEVFDICSNPSGLLPGALLPRSLLKTSQPIDYIFISSMDLFPIPYTTSTIFKNALRFRFLHVVNEASSFAK